MDLGDIGAVEGPGVALGAVVALLHEPGVDDEDDVLHRHRRLRDVGRKDHLSLAEAATPAVGGNPTEGCVMCAANPGNGL